MELFCFGVSRRQSGNILYDIRQCLAYYITITLGIPPIVKRIDQMTANRVAISQKKYGSAFYLPKILFRAVSLKNDAFFLTGMAKPK